MTKKFASVIVILAGAALIAAGISIAVLGDHLTTWSLLDGTDGFSSIREYVGGDAYNYIIGALLVAGHISGSLTMKAVIIAAGVTTACIGLLLLASPPTKKDVSEPSGRHASDEAPSVLRFRRAPGCLPATTPGAATQSRAVTAPRTATAPGMATTRLRGDAGNWDAGI